MGWFRWTDQKKGAKKKSKQMKEWESEAPTDDLYELCKCGKAQGKKKKTQHNVNLVWEAPLSLSFNVSLPLFLWHAGLCPGSLGKCQAVDWQRMKDCGRRTGGKKGGLGGFEEGAEEWRFWGFQTPYLSNISTHFEQVQSQFMKQSTSIY